MNWRKYKYWNFALFSFLIVAINFSISIDAQTWQYLGAQYSVNQPSDISFGYSGGTRSLYLAAQQDVLLYSSGSGINWIKQSGAPTPVLVVCVSTNPSTVYAGSNLPNPYLERSTDNGFTWTPIISGLPFPLPTFTHLAISPTPASLLLGTNSPPQGNGPQGKIGLTPSLLYQSSNGGSSWLSIPTSIFLPSVGSITSVIYKNSSYAFVSVVGSGSTDGIYRTTDNGGSFTQINGGLGGDAPYIYAMASAPQTAGTIICGSNPSGGVAHIFKSTNDGSLWSSVYTFSSGGYVNDIKVDPNSSPSSLVIYAATSNGIIKSSNGGQSWYSMNNTLGDLDVKVIAVDPNISGAVYIGTSSKFYFSSDGGSTWQDAGIDIVTAGGISIYNNDVYCFNGNGSVLQASKLISGSGAWQILHKQGAAGAYLTRDACIDGSNSSYIYSAGNVPTLSSPYRELLNSTNGGTTWNPTYDGVLVNTKGYNAITIDPNASNRVYAVSNRTDMQTYFPELIFSTDHGVTWSFSTSPPFAADYYTFAIDKNSGTPSTVFYAGGGAYLVGPNQFLPGRIISKTTNGGASWTMRFADGNDTWQHFSSIVIDPNNSSFVYAAYTNDDVASANGGILKSHNGGNTWQSVPLPPTGSLHHVVCLVNHPRYSNILFIAEEADPGIWKVSMTTDGAQTWTLLSTNLPSNVKIHHLAFKSNLGAYESPQYLYAATDNGVYALNLNFTISEQVTSGWNMLDVPNVVGDFRPSTVWPTADQGTIYSWNASNQQYYVLGLNPLMNFLGYWVRFPAVTQVNTTGWNIFNDAIVVYNGWNLLGGISQSEPTSSIQKSAEISTVGPYFEYINGGYTPVTTISPGMAVWVQVTTTPGNSYGYLTFTSSAPKTNGSVSPFERYDQFVVTDASGLRQEMLVRNGMAGQKTMSGTDDSIEMPPPPPFDLMSASFKSGKYVETVTSNKIFEDIPIVVRSATYPIVLSWDIKLENGITYRFPGGTTHNGDKTLVGKGRIQIDELQNGTIILEAQAGTKKSLPSENRLLQNYPNPFNPSTTIQYQLKDGGIVKLSIYNVLGQEVKRLIDEPQRAGYNSVNLDAGSLSSGVYYVRLLVTDEFGKLLFLATQKLLLMK